MICTFTTGMIFSFSAVVVVVECRAPSNLLAGVAAFRAGALRHCAMATLTFSIHLPAAVPAPAGAFGNAAQIAVMWADHHSTPASQSTISVNTAAPAAMAGAINHGGP